MLAQGHPRSNGSKALPVGTPTCPNNVGRSQTKRRLSLRHTSRNCYTQKLLDIGIVISIISIPNTVPISR